MCEERYHAIVCVEVRKSTSSYSIAETSYTAQSAHMSNLQIS